MNPTSSATVKRSPTFAAALFFISRSNAAHAAATAARSSHAFVSMTRTSVCSPFDIGAPTVRVTMRGAGRSQRAISPTAIELLVGV